MGRKAIRFTVRNRGGASGGKTIEHEVPEFDWAAFKNTVNAEAFVKKAYFSAAQRICREIHEKKNGTTEDHLQSVESLIARSINFTQGEIEDWINSRDWRRVESVNNRDKAIAFLKKNLPLLANTDQAIPEKAREKVAELVAGLADPDADPVADYLWVKLTQDQTSDELLNFL